MKSRTVEYICGGAAWMIGAGIGASISLSTNGTPLPGVVFGAFGGAGLSALVALWLRYRESTRTERDNSRGYDVRSFTLAESSRFLDLSPKNHPCPSTTPLRAAYRAPEYSRQQSE